MKLVIVRFACSVATLRALPSPDSTLQKAWVKTLHMPKTVSICIIGSGYVGLVAAVCFAEMGHEVTCVDNDEGKVKTLREGDVPIYEEHLPELLGKHLRRGVNFTTDLSEAVERNEAIFIAVGTPQGDTGAADMSYVEAVVSEIGRAITSYKVIVEKSTVPVYTNEWIRCVLHRHGVEPHHFDVVSNPEFLRAGLGYGGSCFPKDVAAFHWVAKQQGQNFQLLEEVRRINDAQRDVFFNKVRAALWTLRGKRLAALGLAFKCDTDDIRESPALDVIRQLLDAGAYVTAYDPAATERAKVVLPPSDKMRYADSLYE